ncbi:LysR family transcriptional regulator [Streptomyces coeruleorubidus]|uniref:LysR family transcriptional regulator n=1 Tax=Streptomyces coeruleorubidus TaxID=116188 RepID=UPI003407FD43
MDLENVRTFLVVADTGRFQEAATRLATTQQAVSKRVATLERNLGVRLFERTSRGVELTFDGQAFLLPAREVLRVSQRAEASVGPGRCALRVDVGTSTGVASVLIRRFGHAQPGVDFDAVSLSDVNSAVMALQSGEVDASFRAVAAPEHPLPAGVASVRVLDEPIQLLVSPEHCLAKSDSVTLAQLVDHRIWMTGIVPGTERAAYYSDLSFQFGLTVEALDPTFGLEELIGTIADTPTLATLVETHSELVWPAHYGLKRIPVTDPVPVYPLSLLWRRPEPHQALDVLRSFLGAVCTAAPDADSIWTPSWAI